MQLSNITIGMPVVYIPRHAKGNRAHKDCEYGVVTDIGTVVFVRFEGDKHSKACYPETLEQQ